MGFIIIGSEDELLAGILTAQYLFTL